MAGVGTPKIDLNELDAGMYQATLKFLEDFGFTKWQVFLLIIILGLIWQIQPILAHIQAMSKIKNDFALNQKKLDAKIERERDKRKRKASKGKTS